MAVFAALLWAGGAPQARPDGGAEVVRRVQVMGTLLEVAVIADHRTTALAASEAAVLEIERTRARLSTWGGDTELSRLNSAAPGTWVPISPRLRRDLREVVGWWRATGGSFHPGLARLIGAWDLRGNGRVPSPEEITSALAHSRMENLELGPEGARRHDPGFGIEEGAFGKGVALRDASHAALAAGALSVRLDLGGQIHLAGDQAAIEIELSHPRRRQRTVAVLTASTGSIATSGNAERGLEVGGVRIGHLLDPRTGWPAPDFGSVTVVADDPVAADCLATGLYVMGPEAGASWLRGRPEIGAIYALDAGDEVLLLVSPGLGDLRVATGHGVRVLRLQPAEPRAAATVNEASDRQPS